MISRVIKPMTWRKCGSIQGLNAEWLVGVLRMSTSSDADERRLQFALKNDLTLMENSLSPPRTIYLYS